MTTTYYRAPRIEYTTASGTELLAKRVQCDRTYYVDIYTMKKYGVKNVQHKELTDEYGILSVTLLRSIGKEDIIMGYNDTHVIMKSKPKIVVIRGERIYAPFLYWTERIKDVALNTERVDNVHRINKYSFIPRDVFYRLFTQTQQAGRIK